MGPCIYTEGMKNAYVPINHVNRITGERLPWQLTENDIKEEFSRLSNTKIIMHNGKFDYSVIKCTCNLELDIYWDTLIGARILNENEKAGLKEQYISKIDPSIEKYSIEHLFSGIEYALVDPDLFALYAATDSFMTYKLYEYQVREFNKEENKELLSAFFENEIPLIKVVAEMEMTGISIDLDYAQELSVEYNKQLTEVDAQIDTELHKYDEQISKWRKTPEANYHPPKCSGMGEGKSKSEQLGSPISVSSTLQLAIFLYDVLKLPSVDKKSPRGTGEEILEKLYDTHKDLTILKLILKRRSVAKLVTTYIDKLPKCIEPSTGKIHCKYNQYGADTGRMSSSDPNLQNIPSSNHDIRKMFVASSGCVLMSSDYSQQEPKSLAALCRIDGDPQMYDVFMSGKDLYVEIASKSFHLPYSECIEHFPKDTPIKKVGKKWYYATKDDYDKLADGEEDTYDDGKARRTQAKSILLGVLYGRGEASIAEQLECSIEEASKIKNSVFKGFPAIKRFEQESLDMARTKGYVTTIYGRRRRLPEIQLPKYEVNFQKGHTEGNFNPLIGSRNIVCNKSTQIIEDYEARLYKSKSFSEVNRIKSEAEKDGLVIKDNGGFIAQAERQCVNARIQGSAADLTKAAMIALYSNQRAKEIGMKILIPVHDELIVECKEEFAKEGRELLASIMSQAAEKILDMPIKCDVTVTKKWYGDKLELD